MYRKYKHHHRVCHATLFPSRAWTDKTNFKAEARDYGKGNYISDACLWCSVNHNALCQLANQSILSLLEGGALWKTTCFREAVHRGPTIMYSSASQTCPQDPLPCTFCMSPLSSTPDSTHQLVRRDCKNLIGYVWLGRHAKYAGPGVLQDRFGKLWCTVFEI